jgi:tetratricopeptide (TPR) repeat protein
MGSRAFETALPHLEKALELAPEKIEVINSLGTCYMAQGNAEMAIKIYEKAVDLNPNSSMAYFNLGSVYQIKQNHQKAVEYLEKAVELEEDERFLSALAMSEMKIKDYDCALKHYKQLAVLCPNKENYKYNVVSCYEIMGDFQTAIKMLEEMVYVNPKFTLPAQKLANLYIKTNQLNKAKDIYDKILLKNKTTAEILHQYAILSSSLCDTDTAERMLKKVIRMKPEIASAHKDLAIIYLNKRLFDYAEDEFKTAMQLAPNDFEIIFEYGNYLYSVSKNIEAERYYAEALELEPNNILALVFMALNKLILNQKDEAYEYIMKAVKIEPDHEYVQFCAGRILYARGEYDEAKRYLVRAAEQNPDVETMNTLALTYFALEDYSQALNIFSSIYKKNPNSISVMMDIARCYEALGENDSALVYLNKVTDIFPENEDAQEMIRKLS